MTKNLNTDDQDLLRDDELYAVNGGSIADYTNALTAVIGNAFSHTMTVDEGYAALFGRP